jgi:hypothetical protein
VLVGAPPAPRRPAAHRAWRLAGAARHARRRAQATGVWSRRRSAAADALLLLLLLLPRLQWQSARAGAWAARLPLKLRGPPPARRGGPAPGGP